MLFYYDDTFFIHTHSDSIYIYLLCQNKLILLYKKVKNFFSKNTHCSRAGIFWGLTDCFEKLQTFALSSQSLRTSRLFSPEMWARQSVGKNPQLAPQQEQNSFEACSNDGTPQNRANGSDRCSRSILSGPLVSVSSSFA